MDLSKENVETVLDKRIRPAIQMDGGNIELVEVRDSSIFVKLVGACGTCPSSQITLRQGVEGILREEFPDMVELVQC